MKRLILTTMLTAGAMLAAGKAQTAPPAANPAQSTATSTAKAKVSKHKHTKSTKQGTSASTQTPKAPVSK